jgi:hypothetical protein
VAEVRAQYRIAWHRRRTLRAALMPAMFTIIPGAALRVHPVMQHCVKQHCQARIVRAVGTTRARRAARPDGWPAP